MFTLDPFQHKPYWKTCMCRFPMAANVSTCCRCVEHVLLLIYAAVKKKRFTSRQEACCFKFSEFKHFYGILQKVQPAYPRPPRVPVRSPAPVTHCDQLPCGPKQNLPSQVWHKHTHLQIQCLTRLLDLLQMWKVFATAALK